MRKIFGAAVVIILATCGASPSWSAGDPCTLVSDPATLFGQPVTAKRTTEVNKTVSCSWTTAEGRVCGSVTVFGPGWNETSDVPRTYGALTVSMGAFGKPSDVSGIGEEARAVDGGMFGAQLAFRTSKAAVLVGAACSSTSTKAPAIAEKLSRAIAPRF